MLDNISGLVSFKKVVLYDVSDGLQHVRRVFENVLEQ